MNIQAFLGGLISMLTPSVLLMTIFLIIALSKINLTGDKKTYFILTFCALIVIFYAIIGILIIDITPNYLNSLSSSFSVKYTFVILNLILGLWLLGAFRIVSHNIESKWLFISIMLLIMAIVFTVSSFSGVGPIIGSLLQANSESTTLTSIMIPLIIFAFGSIIPVGLMLLFMSKLTSKNKENKWLKIVQLLTGGVVITVTIIGLFVK